MQRVLEQMMLVIARLATLDIIAVDGLVTSCEPTFLNLGAELTNGKLYNEGSKDDLYLPTTGKILNNYTYRE